MSKAVKNIMIRAIKERMKQGETLEDIFTSYPKLTEPEKEELREAIA